MIWRPSSQPPLSREQVEALPIGMVVVHTSRDEPFLVTGQNPLRGVLWDPLVDGFSSDVFRMPISLWSFRLPRFPRLSCAATIKAVVSRQKDVTRRVWKQLPGWAEAGRKVLLVDRIRRTDANGLAVVEIYSVRRETLQDFYLTPEEVAREGFDHRSPSKFREMFAGLHGGSLPDSVFRIQWSYYFRELPWRPGLPLPPETSLARLSLAVQAGVRTEAELLQAACELGAPSVKN